MSEEIASADSLLTEIARLQTDLASVRDELAQAQRAVEAERAARMAADVDALALQEGFRAVFYGAQTIDERQKLKDLAMSAHPGAALLTELALARAVVEAQRQHLGCMADDPILDAAMDAYDEAMKARAE
jgi:hypothetical protein